jgi:hypothetical protein
MEGNIMNRRMMHSSLLLAAILLTDVLMAGEPPNIRGMGMARTSVASSLGLDAVGTNPANLALAESGAMSLTILPIGMYLESDFFTYDLYSRYLKNRIPLHELPEGDKQNLLQAFQTSVGHSRAEAMARLFGITLRINSTGNVAFTVDYGLIAAADVPREYARLLLYGNTPGSVFNVEGLALQGFWARTYALSFGQRLPHPSFLQWLAGGVSVKLIQGYGYYEVQSGAASLRTAADGSVVGPVAWRARWTTTNSLSHPLDNLFQNPAGYGFGLDLGLSGGVADFLTFGISLSNIGSVEWTRDVAERTTDSVMTMSEPDVFKRVFTMLKASESVRGGHPFSSTLPSLFRVGIAAQLDKLAGAGIFPGQFLFGLEYSQAVGPRSVLSQEPRFSFGLEYKPVAWLPVRTGVSLGGRSGSHIAFGLGFNFRAFDLDVATEDILWVFEGSRYSTGSLGIGMRVRVP